MATKNQRRKTTYLGWKNHGRIVARFALLWVIYHFTLWEALCTREYIHYLSSISDVEHRVPLAVFFADFIRQNGWMIAFAAVFAVIIVWDVVRLTHRIVGPQKRLENVLYAMADGKSIDQVKFRDGDLSESLEKAFNVYLASLHTSNAQAGGTAAAHDAVAESPTPASNPEERCEPATPLDDQQMAELFHDLRPVNGSAGLVHKRAD